MRRATGIIVAARTDSSRLPGKALLPIAGVPSILFLLRRLAGCRRAEKLIFATTDRQVDDELACLVEAEGVSVYRGACDDVAGRYVAAARKFGLARVLRVTGDCPFLDAGALDGMIAEADRSADWDLATTKGKYPVGIDGELYPAALLDALYHGGKLTSDEREHVTLHLYRPAAFRLCHLPPPDGWPAPATSFTLDTVDDLVRLDQWAIAAGGLTARIEDLLSAAMERGLCHSPAL